MKRNIKIIVIFGVAINLILIISGILFFNFYFFEEKKIPLITGEKKVDSAIFNFWSKIKKQSNRLPEAKELELLNLIYIKKKNSNFEISCQFGPLYYTSNLEKIFPNELISAGRIKKCDEEVAKLIDKIAKGSKRDCRFFLISPVPSSLNEYYLVLLGFGEVEITPELVKWMEKRNICLSFYKNLIGKKIPSVIVKGIVDPRNEIFYH